MYATVIVLFIAGFACGQNFQCPDSPEPCEERLYPYAYDCGKYWSCDRGCISYLFDCPPGLHFDPNTQQCLQPIEVGCVETTTVLVTTPTTTTTTQSTSTATGTIASTTTTPSVLVNPSIFFAGRESNLGSGIDPSISFSHIEVDRHGDFDGQFYTVPTNGTYFFNLNAGFQTQENVNYRLEDPNTIHIHVRRDSDTHNNMDMGSRDYILYFTAGTVLRMTQQAGSGEMYSTAAGLETSFGAFSLHDSIEYISVFSVGRNSSYSTIGIVDMTTITTNVGNDWSSANNQYTAPVTGTYYLSMGASVESGIALRVALTVNGNTVAELYKNHLNNDGLDTFSRSLVINLQAGDIVHYRLVSGSMWANERRNIYLAGFYCKPKYTPTVAWSLHRTTSWAGATNLNPVDYQDVYVNEHNVYNTATNIVTIPFDGFYYIHITAGAASGSQTRLRLWKNTNVELFNLRRYATNHIGTDTLSRSGIFYFYGGDQLTVQSPSGYQFNAGSTNQRLTSFQGFLIYSNQ